MNIISLFGLVISITIIVIIVLSLNTLNNCDYNEHNDYNDYNDYNEHNDYKYERYANLSPSSNDNYDSYPKTFFIDIDGTIVPYLNGELDKIAEIDGYVQELLPGVKEFFNSLKDNDVVIFTTGRRERHRKLTERTLKYNNIKYKHLLMELPSGQRYLVNDTTNMLYQKAIAINLLRDKGFGDVHNYDPKV